MNLKPLAAALVLFTTSAQAQTIDHLSAGATLTGTELLPMFQTANPAVTTTPNALKTFIGTTVNTGPGATGGTCNPGATCTIQTTLLDDAPASGAFPYAIPNTDYGKNLIIPASGGSVTIVAATTSGYGNGFFVCAVNEDTVSHTITPATSTISGNTVVTVLPGKTTCFQSDGTNYHFYSAPSLLASSTVFGIVEVDGTTITATNGVISAVGGGNALFGTATGNTTNDIVTMSNTTVGVKDSGTLLSSLAPIASPTFTGTATSPVFSSSATGTAGAPNFVGSAAGSTTGFYFPAVSGEMGFSSAGTVKFDYGITNAARLTLPNTMFTGTVNGNNTINFNGAASSLFAFAIFQNSSANAAAGTQFAIGNNTSVSEFTINTLSSANTPANTTIMQQAASKFEIQAGGVAGSAAGTNVMDYGVTTASVWALPTIGSDATHTDTSVCQDTTTHGLYSGSSTAGVCLGNVSSIRFKPDYALISDGLGVVNALDPGTYHYISGIPGDDGKLKVGFTAERYASIPQLHSFARFDGNGEPNGLDMLAAFPFAVRAIQQLDEIKADKDDVATLKEIVARQQVEIEDLKRRVH